MRATAEVLYTSSLIKTVNHYTSDTHSTMENHYTYQMPDEVGLSDFECPYCETTDQLREVEL